MKRLLYIFIIALPLMLVACSSGDDTDNNDYITVKESEIISKYYTGQNHHIYFSDVELYHNDETGMVQICICDAGCPNKNGHISENNVSVMDSDSQSIPVIRCRECKAEFDAYKGNALNQKAQGYKIKVYNYLHDKTEKKYLLWERK